MLSNSSNFVVDDLYFSYKIPIVVKTFHQKHIIFFRFSASCMSYVKSPNVFINKPLNGIIRDLTHQAIRDYKCEKWTIKSADAYNKWCGK